jgi:oligopeptide/dipeptide ABC transporter ATP-binding protein
MEQSQSAATLMQSLAANHDRGHLPPLSNGTKSQMLRVSDLSVNVRTDSVHESKIVKQVSFTIAHREIVGLLGESGCGKTTTALAILRLLPPSARIVNGTIHFQGASLLTLDERRLREMRGFQISVIYQDSEVLNPVMRVGDQVMEVLRAHRRMSTERMHDQVFSMFGEMGFDDCARVYRAYPHQLSGGERRRIAIAQALVCRPRLVIADEPTASLDFKTTDELLSLFAHLRDVYDTSFLLISHNPEALMVADRLVVMYAGQVIESGSRSEVFTRPKHPYTRALLQCAVQGGAQSVGNQLRRIACIPGSAPDPSESISGCTFASRCSDRTAACETREPELIFLSEDDSARCLKYGDGA